MTTKGGDWILPDPLEEKKAVEERYMLFAGHDYYPEGGFLDFKGFFKSHTSAIEFFELNHPSIANVGGYISNWGHVVNVNTMRIERKLRKDRE